MIRITNLQASSFLLPIMQTLYQDSSRQFPAKDAFRLIDLVNQVQARMGAYNDAKLKIVQKYEGDINQETGAIGYRTNKDRNAAMEEINELNSVEIEIPVDKIKYSPDWPKLTMAEASILDPLVDWEG
jgi:hypothetical protein